MRAAVVYSRPGCHLCEQLIEELLPLVAGRRAVEVRDVDVSEDWRSRFGDRIPVLVIEGRVVCEGRLDRHAVRQALSGD